VLGEHARLRETMALLTVEGPHKGDSPRSERRLHELIERCTDELIEHFATEEADGYFGTLATDCPRLASAVVRLEVEHEEMRREIKEIRALAGRSGSATEAGRRIGALIGRLQIHEHAENVLLQEFYLADDGQDSS
jgi:iron-sulfur cluster repair protein YtfE (RIC family)